MLTDREAWISVFNTALAAGSQLVISGKTLTVNEKNASPGQWAKFIADQALEDAPKDEA